MAMSGQEVLASFLRLVIINKAHRLALRGSVNNLYTYVCEYPHCTRHAAHGTPHNMVQCNLLSLQPLLAQGTNGTE
jgi:hypothetical protein